MSPGNRKAGDRRLAKMSPSVPEQLAMPWRPDLPPCGEPWTSDFYVNETTRYIQRLAFDEQDRVVEWAVVQQRKIPGGWRDVAVYDTCHDKGVHKHLYDVEGVQFDEVKLRPVRGYRDLEDGLDEAIEQVTSTHWLENERRSERGY